MILFILINVKIYSQKTIGIEAGVNFSTLQFEGNDFVSPKHGIGLNIGINYLYKLNNSFDFKSGIYFKQKGQKIESNGKLAIFMDGTAAYIEELEKYKLNYVQFPISINYNINKSIFISSGIYFAYGLKSYYSIKSTYLDVQTKEVVREGFKKEELSMDYETQMGWNIDRTMEKWDYGLGFGIGYRFGRLSVKSEFDLGLAPVIKIYDTSFFSSNSEGFKNRTLSLSLICFLSKKYYLRY